MHRRSGGIARTYCVSVLGYGHARVEYGCPCICIPRAVVVRAA